MTIASRWTPPIRRAGGVLLCRVAGVPVVLAPSWWLGAIVITVLYAPMVSRLLPDSGAVASVLLAMAGAVVLGLSVLVHELGHCLVALYLGLPVRRVRLHLLGGVSEIVRTPRKPSHEAVVAAAGPGVSVVLALVAGAGWAVLPPGGALWLLAAQTAVVNGAVAVSNLLPGLPLDGGRLLRAVVWGLTGRRSVGTRVAVVGAGVVALGLMWWAVLGMAAGVPDRWPRLGVCTVMACFVVVGAGGELTAQRRRWWPAGLRVADLVRPVLQLPAESPVADALAASAGRGVVLVRADGLAAGLLDQRAAQRLAAVSPLAPAAGASEPIRPETVLLESEPDEEVVERVNTTAAWQFLVVDEGGRPAGVLCRQDLRAALGRCEG